MRNVRQTAPPIEPETTDADGEVFALLSRARQVRRDEERARVVWAWIDVMAAGRDVADVAFWPAGGEGGAR